MRLTYKGNPEEGLIYTVRSQLGGPAENPFVFQHRGFQPGGPVEVFEAHCIHKGKPVLLFKNPVAALPKQFHIGGETDVTFVAGGVPTCRRASTGYGP